MANCKYCHEPITRLDKDVCPFCGGRKPLEGTDTTTQDITKVISEMDTDFKINHKSRITAALLAIFLGPLGIHSIYLGKYKHALIVFLVSFVFIGGLGSIIYVTTWQNILAYLCPYFAVELFMIGVGIGYLIRSNVTDSKGEFLK